MADLIPAGVWQRVSTADQTTLNQEQDLDRLMVNRGFSPVRRYDITASAFKGDQRVMLEAVLADASHGEFKVLITWSLDRLTRLGGEHLLELLGHLADRNVIVISYNEPWVENMRDEAVRKFLVYMMGWMAQSESRLRSERSKAGQRRALAQGKHVGRPGGRKDSDSTPAQREASRLRRSAGQKARRLKEMARKAAAAKLAPKESK